MAGFWLLLFSLLAPTAVAESASNSQPASNPTTEKDTWVPFKATYVAIMNGTTVDDDGARILEYRGDGHFRFSTIAENLLFRFEEVTDFKVMEGKVYPLQYHSERSAPFQTRKKAVGYNWKNNTAHYQYKDRKGTLKLKGRVLDPLTTAFELARSVKQGQTNISFQEVGSRKIKDRHFKLVGEETLTLPYGELKTLKLRMQDDDDKETLIWLAPDKNYLTVKVKQNDEGEEYKLELKSYSPRTPVHLPLTTETSEPEPEPEITEPPPEPGDIK